ncbi:hypothetical protein OGATHE_000423 [Ogataea polymorpha]|uniref:Uncharacterized protein n=1 Tax=Ogataea polymorpha TaxID=460523 RepID=A0A9P8PUT3_9ASCO|nr:hypothetical protein OGATHE_000423 [Ogataea polymorpha]
MEPRCTGMCGALATKRPSGPKIAHEKSSRSLIDDETDVRCSVRPIVSAMPMNLWPNTVSRIGSALLSGVFSSTPPISTNPLSFAFWMSITTWESKMVATENFSTRIVCVESISNAGPLILSPGRRCGSLNTLVSTGPSSKCTVCVLSKDSGQLSTLAYFSSCSSMVTLVCFFSTLIPLTETVDVNIGELSGSTNPNSLL